MKAVATWTKQFQGVVTDKCNRSIVIDVSEEKGGCDTGSSALELCIMGFAGCIETIFAMVAPKMRISFQALEVEALARIEEGYLTFSHVDYVLRIKTDASEEKIAKCLETVEKTCPVGVLFSKAGIKISGKIEML